MMFARGFYADIVCWRLRFEVRGLGVVGVGFTVWCVGHGGVGLWGF